MASTQITGKQIADGSIERSDINISAAGKALIRKIIATPSTGITISSYTGADSGTGDVTLAIDTNTIATRSWVQSQAFLTATALNGYATQQYVNTQVSNLVGAAPSTLDTLNELAAAIGNDVNFATTVTNSIASRVPQSRTITINGVSFDLSANRSWTISTSTADGYIQNVQLVGNELRFAGVGSAFTGNIDLTQLGYLTSFTETDPTVPAHVKSITSTEKSNWNTAYSWGNHALAGYLTSLPSHNHDSLYVKLDGTSIVQNTLNINSNEMGGTARSWMTRGVVIGGGGSDGAYFGMKVISANNAQTVIAWGDDSGDDLHFINTISGGPVDGVTYMTFFGSQNTIRMYKQLDVQSTIYSSEGNSSQWSTAYSWGNHVSQGYATTSYVTTQINNLINGAPGALDTLNELASALGNDANFATTVTNSIAGKVSKSGDTMTGDLYAPRVLLGSGTDQGYVGSGGLKIGRTDTNYTQGYGWGGTSSTMFIDCQRTATITIHDSGHRLVEYMTFEGDSTNIIYSGRDIGWGTTSWFFGADVTVDGIITENSSIRYKENVRPLESVSDKIAKVAPIRYNKKGGSTEEIGLIAEDMASIYPEVVKFDAQGRPDGINYTRLSAILIKAVQELTNKVNELEKKA